MVLVSFSWLLPSASDDLSSVFLFVEKEPLLNPFSLPVLLEELSSSVVVLFPLEVELVEELLTEPVLKSPLVELVAELFLSVEVLFPLVVELVEVVFLFVEELLTEPDLNPLLLELLDELFLLLELLLLLELFELWELLELLDFDLACAMLVWSWSVLPRDIISKDKPENVNKSVKSNIKSFFLLFFLIFIPPHKLSMY